MAQRGFPWWTLPVALAGTGMAARLALTHPGLPIDDAYIYQVYAANLAAGQGLSFNPGEVSFGATSTLWALVLAALNLLFVTTDAPGAAQSLTIMLGALTLIQAQRLVRLLTRSRIAAMIAGLTVATMPDLLMQRVSGMDTEAVLLVWLTLLIQLARRGLNQPVRTGLLLGILALLRPEMLWPVPLVALAALMLRPAPASPVRSAVMTGGVALVMLLPNLLYVYMHTGHPLPTTFYGKSLAAQAGVADWGWYSRTVRTIALGLGGVDDILHVQLWTAAQLVLWMGLLYGIVRLWRFLRRDDMRDGAGLALALAAIMLGLPFLFAAGLPVHPHDGGYFHRYWAPATLTLPLLGWTGLWRGFFFERPQGRLLLTGLFFMAGLLANAWHLPAKWQSLESDYGRIVAQNTLLRRTVAQRIDEGLPSDARLMVGQSGLGVIGLHAHRYCKDEGALINPDIFPYYEPVQRAGLDARWKALRRYMEDQRLDHWVTVPADRSAAFAEGELVPVITVTLPDELAWGGLTQLVVYRFSPQSTGDSGRLTRTLYEGDTMKEWTAIFLLMLSMPLGAEESAPAATPKPSMAERVAALKLDSITCPEGTEWREQRGAGGIEQYCEKSTGGQTLREGPYSRWSVLGGLITTGEYRKGEKHGVWTEHHPKGGKSLESHYAGGQLEGEWTAWNGKGEVMGTGKIVNGTGPWGTWHENGQKSEEGQYRKGMRDGDWKWWYPTGQIKQEGHYELGWQKGVWTNYLPNGRIISKGERNMAPPELQTKENTGTGPGKP